MADENKIENGEEKRDKNFSKELKETHDVLDMIKDSLDETTSKVIEDLGYERNEKVAGVYGDGSTYGAGVEENKYNVIVTGRPRKFDSSKDMDHGPNSGTVEKQIFIGAKRVESQVDYEIKGKMLSLQYRSPESGFFRGIDDNGKSFMVKEKLTVPISKAKKALKDLFTDAAEREVGFLTNTKLGVEDRLDASTTSIVENLNIDMKKLTIKSLFEDELSEGFDYELEDLPMSDIDMPIQDKSVFAGIGEDGIEDNSSLVDLVRRNSEIEDESVYESEDDVDLQMNVEVEPNIEKVQKLNTQRVDDVEGDKYLLFDDEESDEDFNESAEYPFYGEGEIYTPEGMDNMSFYMMTLKDGFREALSQEFGTQDIKDLTPAERSDRERMQRVYDLSQASLSDASLEEITASGGGAGAGGYDTKSIATNKRTFKGGKKSEVGDPYNVPVNDAIYQEESLNERKESKYKKTSYAKSKTSRPKLDKDYNIIPEERDTNSSKPYIQVVKVDPNTHPQGMPFVTPNSEEELKRTSGVGKDSDKMARMGINESASDKNRRLSKRKFSSETENKKQGINKKYIVTEKTTQEYEKERWGKLSMFNKFETIKEAEEMNSVFENLNENEDFYAPKTKLISESVESSKKEVIVESDNSKEETVEVEKPNSSFGITQKFYKKDFLNENKRYILDLNSMVFVSNPNGGK